MPRTANPAIALLKRLREAGYKTPYVKKTVLPDWWESALVKDEAAYFETIGHIANGLGLDAESLLDAKSEIRSATTVRPKFKKSQPTAASELDQATGVAVSLAQAAAEAYLAEVKATPSNAVEIRQSILEESECVTFESLLAYCWEAGIIVLPVTKFPGKKPDGMALLIGKRPVIVLSKSSPHPAWSVFDLAHELSHILLGHVKEGVPLVDERIDAQDTDDEEREANDFAVELLLGDSDTSFWSRGRLRAEVLAAKAKNLGKERCIDPGVIVLNYARTMKKTGLPCWPLAQAALKQIPSAAHPMELLREQLLARLDLDELTREKKNWLLKATESQ